EGVVSAVPGDIDEPNEDSILGPGGDPAKAVAADVVPPPDGGATAVGLHEFHHLGVRQRTPPLVCELAAHRSSLTAGRLSAGTPDRRGHRKPASDQPPYPRGVERFFADERERRSISMPSRRHASPYSKRLSLLSGAPPVNSLVRSG